MESNNIETQPIDYLNENECNEQEIYSNSPLPLETNGLINSQDIDNNTFQEPEQLSHNCLEPNNIEFSFNELKAMLSKMFIRHILSKNALRI